MPRHSAFETDYRDLHGDDPNYRIEGVVYPGRRTISGSRDPMPGAGLAWRFMVALVILICCAIAAVVAAIMVGFGVLSIAVAVRGFMS